MKPITNYLKSSINEGWTGSAGEKAYQKILDAFEDRPASEFIDIIWSYLSSDQLQNIYKWLKEDEYID